MKANTKHNFRRVLIIALSVVCCLSLFTAIGCSGKGAQKSVFYQDGTAFVLESDYTLSTVDEKARRGGKNEVRFTQAISLDLQGHTLDLGGRTLTVENDGKGVVTFKNGTITDGKLNISVPNGDVDFDNVTIAETVSYELEAASETIRMNNSNLNGQCTIKSNTHVEINRSSVSDLTLSGSGYVNVNEGATLGKLEVGKNAEGAKVKVGETSKITGELNVSAAADVVVSGEVANLNVTEEAGSGKESKLNVTVKSTANVLKLALKAAADVQVQGTVSSVEVESDDASVNVTENATVFTVKMSAAGEVSVAGEVLSIVVADTAEGAKVGLEDGAKVQDIVVGANGTEITVAENAKIESVKVSEDVTDAAIPDTVTTETVSKDQLAEYDKHTHVYKLTQKTAQTCTADGKEVYECVDCGEVYERVYKALGHDYKYETIKAPTETSAGQGKYTCTRCGHGYTVVLKPEGATVVTVSGLSEILRKVFGEGFQVDLGNVVYVQKEVEKNYKDGKLESTEYTYYLTYIKQCDLRFDFSSDEKVKGSFNLMAYGLETEDISKIDLSDLSTVDFADEAIIHAYLDGEKVYIYASEEIAGEDGNIAVSLEKLLEYLCESDEVPEAINLLANALRFLIDLDGEEVDMTSVYMVLGALQNALSSFNPADGMNVFAKFMLDNFFAKTVGEDGLTTYTFDFEKVKDTLNYYSDMTLSKFIDELFGDKASKNLFETLRLIPDLTVNNAVTYLKNQLANYAIDLETVYPYVESFIYENLGVTVSVEELLDTFGDSNVAAFIALIGDIDLDEAEEIVKSAIETVIEYMNALTVDDAVTYLYNYVKDSVAGGGNDDGDVDYPYYPDEDEYYDEGEEGDDEDASEELSAVQIVCALIDYVKDYVTLKYVTGENFNKVYVDVAGYNFTLSIAEKDGFTLETAVAIAEKVMAEISVKLNENKFGFSADVLNYGVEATADKEKGTFTVSVYQNKGEDESEKLAALTFACVNNELVLQLSVLGDKCIDFTAGTESGNLDLMIPTALDDYIAVNVNWETEDDVTTVYVAYDETVLRVTFNLSQKASLAISVGEFDEDDDFVATLENVFTADLSVTADQNGALTGMTVEYALDGSNVDSWNDFWSDANLNDETIVDYLTQYFYLWKHKVEISFNQKITADETNKDLVKGDIEKLQKLEFEYAKSKKNLYQLFYVEEEVDGKADAYYVLTNTQINNYGEIYETSWALDIKDGLPNFAMFAYAKDCGDWYNLSISFNGQAQVNVYNGVDDDPVDSYVIYETDSVSFYYNVKTGETTKNSQHDWTVTDVKYHSDSHKCEDGLTVTTKCSLCGKTETETNDDGCVWITKEVKTITTTCGDMRVVIKFCPGCNDTDVYYSWYGAHDEEYSEKVSLSKEDLKEKYPTAYHISDSGSYICMLCNLVVEEYTIYTHDATNGCHRHDLYRFLQIDHNTEEATLLYETEEDRHDKHYTSMNYDNCRPIVIDEDDEYTDEELAAIKANNAKGQEWLSVINRMIGRNYSLSKMSEISYVCEKCDGCGRLECKYYRWRGYDYTTDGGLTIYYNGNSISYISYSFEERTSSVYTVISTALGDKLDDVAKYFGSALKALSGQSAEVHYYSNAYSIYIDLANGDSIWINKYSHRESTFSWYDYSECLNTTLTFKDNGKVVVEENEQHWEQWQIIHLGDNCEDGWYEVRVCMVCGHKDGGEDDVRYYHHDHWPETDEIKNRICDNLYVSYHKTTYDCCGAVVYSENLEVSLKGNVVLDRNVYIYYDYDINLRLNGYTLDLNGYDFVICSNGGKEADVNIYDTGRYVYNEETGEDDYVLGNIVDGKAKDEKGLLVICVKDGNIDVANINIRCNSFLSDDDDATTIVESVYNDKGYVLTLGTRYPQI